VSRRAFITFFSSIAAKAASYDAAVTRRAVAQLKSNSVIGDR